MPKPLTILEEAADEAREAFQRYLERSERAAHRFQQAVEKAVEGIRNEPARWPEYHHGTRYVQLRNFPYLIIFRETADEIQVIAVAHGHRREGYWKTRVE